MPPYISITLAVIGGLGLLASWASPQSSLSVLQWLLPTAAGTFVIGRLVAFQSRKMRGYIAELTEQGFEIGHSFDSDNVYVDKTGTKIAFRKFCSGRILSASDILDYNTEWKARTGFTGVQYFGCVLSFTIRDPATPLIRISYGPFKHNMDTDFARLQAIFASAD